MTRVDEGTDQGDAATSQGMPECHQDNRIQERGLEQEEPAPATLGCRMSGLQDWEKTNFCCSSHRVCGTL